MGNFLRNKQHGLPPLKTAGTEYTPELSAEVRECAENIVADLENNTPQYNALKDKIIRLFGGNI